MDFWACIVRYTKSYLSHKEVIMEVLGGNVATEAGNDHGELNYKKKNIKPYFYNKKMYIANRKNLVAT